MNKKTFSLFAPFLFSLLLIGCINQPEPQEERFYELISQQFGLNKTDYTLEFADSYLIRGGFLKAKGKTTDGKEFELYHHYGGCSSGGSDCGWSNCFSSTSSQVFETSKNKLCNEIYSFHAAADTFCAGPELDQTSEVRKKCFEGGFEKTSGQKRTISITQQSGRCESSVQKAEFNCLEIKPP